MITDHHKNNEKFQNIARIIKMWHKDTKGVNAVGKIASIDAGLPQTFYLLKKKSMSEAQ